MSYNWLTKIQWILWMIIFWRQITIFSILIYGEVSVRYYRFRFGKPNRNFGFGSFGIYPFRSYTGFYIPCVKLEGLGFFIYKICQILKLFTRIFHWAQTQKLGGVVILIYCTPFHFWVFGSRLYPIYKNVVPYKIYLSFRWSRQKKSR